MEREPDGKPLGATLGHRYGGAWSEINTRLQSRQTVNLAFVTLTVTATSAILGAAAKPTENGVLAASSAGLVLLAWAFVLWIRQNDAIIGLLSSFCRAIERIDDPKNELGIPAWHDDRQGFILEARQLRELSDRSTTLLALLAAVPALVLGCQGFWNSECWLGAALVAFGIAGIGAAGFAYRNGTQRKKIASMSFRKVNGEWLFISSDPARDLALKS